VTTILVYEHLTACEGAMGDGESPLAPSLLAEGRAMRDAVCADFERVAGTRVRTLDTDSEAAFRKEAAAAGYALVIAPEFDGILEQRCRWIEESGSELLGPTPAAVRLTADKLRLAQYLRAGGVPTPECWPLGEEPAGTFPLVWKPRDGAGSQQTFLLDTIADQQRVQAVVRAEGCASPMIAQRFVPGVPASVAFLIGPREATALVPCRQHLSNDGRLTYRGGSLPLPEPLASRARQVASAAVGCVTGLRGYVGVDVVVSENEGWVIEINPRLTTSYIGLRALARFNLAEAMLAAVRGEGWPSMEWERESISFTADGRVGTS
jgi:tyramine---L-glutamate ligase